MNRTEESQRLLDAAHAQIDLMHGGESGMSTTQQSDYARFNFVAWQRAPRVKAVAVADDPAGTHIKYECGHDGYHARHFDHQLGNSYRCIACGKLYAATLPEFNPLAHEQCK